MGVYVDLLPGKDRAAVEKQALAELARLRDKPIDEAELKRVKQLILSAAVFRKEIGSFPQQLLGNGPLSTAIEGDTYNQVVAGLRAGGTSGSGSRKGRRECFSRTGSRGMRGLGERALRGRTGTLA
jgi:hypothetical protein